MADEDDDTVRNAWQASPVAIVTLDGRGRVGSCNPASQRIFGRGRSELVGLELGSLTHSLDRGALEQMLAEARRGRVPARQEIRFDRPGGDEVVTGFTVGPTRRPGDAMVCVLRDLSREKAFRPQLLHTERMASIGMVASVVAHELNNALAGAQGCLQLLPEPPEGQSRELLASVASELRRAGEIVRELKGYARVEEGMSDRFQISDVVARVERLRRFQATEGRPRCSLMVELPELPELEGSANQMLQALLNLVRNAEQAVAELPEERRVIRIHARVERGAVVLAVSDRGPGIPLDERVRLFEPFFSTKAAGDGTGLGLTVVQAVAAGHGGRVEIDETPGGGATFRLVLPYAAEPEPEHPPEAKAEAPVAYPRLQGVRILVADDEPLIRRVVQRCCRGHGAVLVEVEDGRQAKDALGEGDFDLVLLDVRMPGGGGAGVFRTIRRSYPHLVGRTIFMSGDISSDMAELVGTGHAGVLPKPFDLRTLLAALDGVLATASGATA